MIVGVLSGAAPISPYGVGEAGSTTVTLALPERVPDEAVIVDAPAASPLTSPWLVTEATVRFELLQDTLPGTSLSAASSSVAVI